MNARQKCKMLKKKLEMYSYKTVPNYTVFKTDLTHYKIESYIEERDNYIMITDPSFWQEFVTRRIINNLADDIYKFIKQDTDPVTHRTTLTLDVWFDERR